MSIDTKNTNWNPRDPAIWTTITNTDWFKASRWFMMPWFGGLGPPVMEWTEISSASNPTWTDVSSASTSWSTLSAVATGVTWEDTPAASTTWAELT